MIYYAKVLENTIQIFPRWKNKLSDEFLTDKEYAELAYGLMLENEFLIPLAKLDLKKVPQTVTIYYGNKMYERLGVLVDEIYSSRSYNITETSAKKRIRNLAIKAMLNKSKLYGKEISYKFDFIDASNYKIELY